MEFPLPFSWALLPIDTYLVGGAVRDALLNRQRYPIDLDLVVPVDAIELARQIASQYDAGFVILDAERSIARVVFAESTVDLAQQMGGSLDSDLHRRDYRMNAIAYHVPTQQLVDPLKGSTDIEQRVVRMVAPANLAADPVRLLRGYRQAAQLGFSIEPATQQAIQKLAPLLSQVAAERVLAEIRYLVSSSLDDPQQLAAAVASGLLDSWLPEVNQPRLLENLQKVIAVLELIDRTYPALSHSLNTNLRPTIHMTGAGTALLATLLQPIAPASVQLLRQLTASTAEIRAIQTALTGWPQLAQANPAEPVPQYHLFLQLGNIFPIAVILSLASGRSLSEISHLIERYLDPADPLAHPIPLLNGSELMAALDLKPSPLVGQLLQAVQLAQVCNTISTKPEAVNYALTSLNKLRSCYI
jgi:tRNA nucleotidyltransferase (CCA-adding enzyme)